MLHQRVIAIDLALFTAGPLDPGQRSSVARECTRTGQRTPVQNPLAVLLLSSSKSKHEMIALLYRNSKLQRRRTYCRKREKKKEFSMRATYKIINASIGTKPKRSLGSVTSELMNSHLVAAKIKRRWGNNINNH